MANLKHAYHIHLVIVPIWRPVINIVFFIKSDNDGDIDNANDYRGLGEKGVSNAVHDKNRNDHVSEQDAIIHALYF